MTDVRLAEVAARAGVSAITVSRALRTPDMLKPETRARVAAAMRELGYVPNLVAGALASARSRAIAALVPTIGNSIFSSTIEGLSAELEPRGYAIILAQSGYDTAREERVLMALLARRPEALVIIGSPATDAAAALLRRAAIPVVELWDLPERPIDAAVGFDNRAAGAAVAEHFFATGRRRLGFIGGPDRRAVLRWEGFSAAAARASMAPPRRVVLAHPATADAAAACAHDLAPHVDAVFTSTDVYALGLLSGLRSLGRRVPADVALVGLGDLEIARHTVPALSSVRIDGGEIGREAARLVLGRDGPRQVDLGFTLVRRESS
jgi:LacI family transcriptional regulator, gluconate utilization system Gnt-I transcriptional repressor